MLAGDEGKLVAVNHFAVVYRIEEPHHVIEANSEAAILHVGYLVSETKCLAQFWRSQVRLTKPVASPLGLAPRIT